MPKPIEIPVFAFTGSCDGLARELTSDVSISQAFHPARTPPPKRPPSNKYNAIWDTGATGTVITQKVIDQCRLSPIGMVKVSTAQGEMLAPVYLANVLLPNNVGFFNLRVTRGNVHGNADVLIGMDIIVRGDFAVTNKDGKTTFSFRIPSVECIDFVDQARQKPSGVVPQISQPLPKVGRNDPCPCGSGKKYKKCCGK